VKQPAVFETTVSHALGRFPEIIIRHNYFRVGDNPEVTEEIGSYVGSNGTTPTGGRGFCALPPSLNLRLG